MSRMKIIAMAVLALIAIIIVLQNTAAVDTRLLFVTVSMPRAVLLLLAMVIGFVLGLLFSLSSTRKKAAD